MICASYGSEIEIIHACNEPQKSHGNPDIYNREAKEMSSPSDAFYPRHPQTFRDARHKIICNCIEGDLITCNKCGGFVRSGDIPNNFYKAQSSKRRVSNGSSFISPSVCFHVLPILTSDHTLFITTTANSSLSDLHTPKGFSSNQRPTRYCRIYSLV